MSSDAFAQPLNLTVPSTYESLEEVVDAVMGYMERHGHDEDYAYRVVLLVSEATTNAVEHGNGLDPTKSVHVRLATDTSCVEITVTDEGGGFDRSDVDDPLAEDNLLSDGGRGLFLIEELADVVRYEDKGRSLWMRICRE